MIIWSPEALNDLAALRTYVSQHNPAAAARVALAIIESVEALLADHPKLGRPGRVSGTRELVVLGTPYIVPYRVRADDVHVLRVYHAARSWPVEFS